MKVTDLKIPYRIFSYSEWRRYIGSMKPRQPRKMEGAYLSRAKHRTIRGFDYRRRSDPLMAVFNADFFEVLKRNQGSIQKRRRQMEKRLFTSESVTEGHPDKVCDAISDAILDACMEQGSDEPCCLRDSSMYRICTCNRRDYHKGIMLIFLQIVRDTVKEIGYDHSQNTAIDGNTCAVMVAIRPAVIRYCYGC